MRHRLLALMSLALCAPAMADDLLPLNDGLYVADPRLCSMSMDDMHFAYGDLVGMQTRTVEGSYFSHNYESGCTTTDVSANGDQVTATMTCTGEGEEWTLEQEFTIPNKDSFSHLSYDFVRCGSKLAEDTNSPTTKELIAQWHEANGTCRGSSDNDESLMGCGKRDLLDEMLTARGWCYSQEYWSGADNTWHVCQSELKIIY